ncbi:MAG: YidH family protein [Planctomycetaceae bacterium]
MNESRDPRVFLASERTLLAWVRTGIAVMGLGFVVAKFGLFLAAAGVPGAEAGGHFRSTTIGIILVIAGGGAVTFAARQHQQFCRTLAPGELPRDYSFRFAPWFAFVLAAVSVLLAVHLLWRAVEHDTATNRLIPERQVPAAPDNETGD